MNFSPFRFWIYGLIFLLIGGGFSGCEENENAQKPPAESPPPELPTPTNYMQYSFSNEGDTFTLSVPELPSLFNHLADAPHSFWYQGERPRDWQKQYYTMFLSEESENTVIQGLTAAIEQLAPAATLDEKAVIAIRFVQGAIQYDWQTFYNIGESKVRYPYETLYHKTGVCADKSLLLARILQQMGYQVGFFTFEKANHMALGLKVPARHGDYGTDYLFVESTDYTPIGMVPDTYAGGIKLDARPKFIPMEGGSRVFEKITEIKQEQQDLKQKYGKEYLFYSPEMKEIKQKMVEAEASIKSMEKDYKKCSGTLTPEKFKECKALQIKLNGEVEAFNQLVNEFNLMVAAHNARNQQGGQVL